MEQPFTTPNRRGRRQPKVTSTLTQVQKDRSVAIWLKNFKVFEFETEITAPVNMGRNFLIGGRSD